MLPVRPLLPAAALALLLTACGSSSTVTGTSTSTKDYLSFSSSNVPVGYIGEAYTAPVPVAGGVGPYTVRLATGKLPDGLTLSGQTITGKPTKEGLYPFTLDVSDASLSSKVQNFSLTVSALPPLSLAFTLPTGEIRGETRLPLTVRAPRGMRAFRLQWTLPAGLNVTRVTPVDTRAVAYWRQAGGKLTLDMGFRAAVQSGDRLALVTVSPAKPITIPAPQLGFSALGADGKSIQEQALPTPAPTVPAPTTPAKPAGTSAPSAAPQVVPTQQPATPPATQPSGTQPTGTPTPHAPIPSTPGTP